MSRTRGMPDFDALVPTNYDNPNEPRKVMKRIWANDETVTKFPPFDKSFRDEWMSFIQTHPGIFVESFRGNTTIEEATIDFTSLFGLFAEVDDDEFARVSMTIGQALGEMKGLAKIDFSLFVHGTGIQLEGGNMASLLSHIPHDNLTTCKVSILSSVRALEESLAVADEELRRHTALEELCLYVRYCDPNNNNLRNPFPESISSLPNLRSLSFHAINMETNQNSIISNFNVASVSLRKLYFYDCLVDRQLNTVLTNIVSKNPYLESLIFRCCTITGDNAEELFDNIGKLSYLRTLRLHSPADIKAYAAIANCLKNSRSLIEAYIKAKDNPAEVVVDVVGLGHIFYGGIIMSAAPLETLHISGYNYDDFLREGLRSCLLAKPSLKTLVLSQVNSKLWFHTCSCVADGTSLRKFHVDNLDTDLPSFIRGISSLATSNTLESLVVKSIGSPLDTLDLLLETIPKFSKETPLKEISFERVIIDRVAQGEELLKVLQNNFTLTECPFKNLTNTLSDEDGKRIESHIKTVLKLNKHGRRYLLDDRSDKKRAVSLLAAVSDDLNCVFYHIMENPALCCRDVYSYDARRTNRTSDNMAV